MNILKTFQITGKQISLTFISVLISALFLFNSTTAAKNSALKIEYIAHACFVIHSPEGKRIVIDPYNENLWMGYSFPKDILADAVLITHPHFDHDASYYFNESIPVFREPQKYILGDVLLEGVSSKHGNAVAMEKRQITPFNTVWVVETAGLRIAHLGDSELLEDSTIRNLGRIDILIVDKSLLEWDKEGTILKGIKPKIIIPMHYWIPALSDRGKMLGDVEPWLATQKNIVRVENNQTDLTKNSLKNEMQIYLFQPSMKVKPWSKELNEAWSNADRAQSLIRNNPNNDRNEIIELYRKAINLSPTVINFYLGLGNALFYKEQNEEALKILEQGLVRAANDDWETTLRVRALLAKLYIKMGKPDLAEIQYRQILLHKQSYLTTVKIEAEQFIKALETAKK